MTKPAIVDPWLQDKDGNPDPFSANIDWHMPDLPDPDEPLSSGDPVLEVPPVTPVVDPPAPVEDQPEILDLEDGTQLILQKDKGWWTGSVVGSTGNAQVYKGETKNKLIMEVLKAQANATKKIREQNTKLKLKFNDAPAAKPQAAPPVIANAARQLTAEEVFEIKTAWDSNPAAALDLLMKKTRGVTMDEVLTLAQQGASKGEYAANQLTAEQVNKSFLANNPDYYADPEYTNFGLLVKWLARFKLGESVPRGQETAVFEKLISTGNYTLENLEEAFQDLSSDELLIQAPKAPPLRAVTPTPVQVQNEPAPAPRPDPRIVSTETRPRASFGIQKADITPVRPPDSPKEPSVEDFENMTDEEIKQQIAGVRRYRALQNRRSN
jgi:hypothetical protein